MTLKTCKNCKVEFGISNSYAKRGNGIYCSMICRKSYGIKGERNPNWKGGKVDIKCLVCKNTFKTKICLVKTGKNKFCSKKCSHAGRNKSNLKRGADNMNWKGDNVGYRSLHHWVERYLGKPITCNNCGLEELNTRKIHWANKSGKYLRDLSDWERLCIKCHQKRDGNLLKGWQNRKNKKRSKNGQLWIK